MKKNFIASLLFLAAVTMADTVPPGAVKIKGGTDGTLIGNVSDSAKVIVTNLPSPTPTQPVSGTVTANQGTSPWVTSFSAPQPVTQSGSWSLSVSNFPATQPVSGTVTANQGGAPWTSDLIRLNGLVPSATNYLPSRITNGTTYVDPTQTRALTTSDQVTAFQGGSPWTTNSTVTNSFIPVTQSGTWSVGRTWTLGASDSVNVLNFPATQPISGSVSVSNFPVTQAVTGTFFQATQPVSGTFFQATQPVSAASLPLPSGASTSALQTTGNTSLSSIDTKTPALGQALAAASVPVVLTAAQLTTLTPLSSVSISNFPATQPVSGTVAVSNFPASQAVTGTFFQATQPVSGTVTANAGTNLNTSALALDTTVSSTQLSQGSTTSGQKGSLTMGAVTTNSPTYVTAQTSPLSLNVRGAQRIVQSGGDTSQLIRNNYATTNVTTAAYVQLVASTANNINRLYIFDSSGQDLVLAVGAAASEVDQIQIPQGGWDAPVDLFIPSGSRISIKAVSASATSGILNITGIK